MSASRQKATKTMTSAAAIETIRHLRDLSEAAWEQCVEDTLPGLAHNEAEKSQESCLIEYDRAIENLTGEYVDNETAEQHLQNAAALERAYGSDEHAQKALSALE